MQPEGCDTPKPKRTPVKRTKEQLWSALPSEQSPIQQDLEKLREAVSSLQKRLNSLEEGWEELLEHLCEQEDITECTQEEDEMN